MQALYGKLNDLSVTEVINVLWALAVTGSYDHEVFASLNEFMWDAIPAASPRQLAVMAAAFASYGHFDDDEDLFTAMSDCFCRYVHWTARVDFSAVINVRPV